MRRLLIGACSLLLWFGQPHLGLAEPAARESSHASSNGGWTRLFDGKTFHGWYPKFQNHKRGDDPGKYFQIEDGVIHVYKDQAEGSAVPSGYMATDAEYAYYHLKLEFKWGTKRFRPRATVRRDAGVLYHLVGPDVVWPQSIECQIQEKDVGDCYTVRTRVDASVQMVSTETPTGMTDVPQYKPAADGGVVKTVGEGSISRIIKSDTPEHDGWNTVEVIVRGSEGSEHIVNGDPVLRAEKLRRLVTSAKGAAGGVTASSGPADKNWEPLGHGRIAIQAEFAEVYYRNIEIKPIPEGPLKVTRKQ